MKKKLSAGKVCAWVFGIICIIVVTAIIVKIIDDNGYANVNRISKWGVSFEIKKDPKSENFIQRLENSEKDFQVFIEGTFDAPKPNEHLRFNFVDVFGTPETDIKLTNRINVRFDDNAYMLNGVFNCPLVVYCGKDDKGNSYIVDGADYIGKRDEFTKKIEDTLMITTENYLPNKQNFTLFSEDLLADYYIFLPEGRSIDAYQGNTKYTIGAFSHLQSDE